MPTYQSKLDALLKKMDKPPIPEKCLIVTGCSKTKLDYPAPAREFYQGQFAQGVVGICDKFGMDLQFLSGKYGLVGEKEMIAPYDQKARTKADISRLRADVKQKFPALLEKYDKVLLLMGSDYRSAFDDFLTDAKILFATDPRGSGGFKQLVCMMNDLSPAEMREFVRKQRGEFSYTTPLR